MEMARLRVKRRIRLYERFSSDVRSIFNQLARADTTCGT